ncbi:three-Cys-motif partner protein TcmP [Mesorhizobium microcysteis]|uniref:Three-Cys-motif partner protein TcmP n=1 Tax=Neoaquamicrobium microcysteis TaxID=2682781 RepID=A0A5D4H607_9HYPH|nr:three-Cys-motif partner protein TcmP [Mesorhizobium microcysteis]TYR36057.1 three-Cys-motif partner protein TcmP [Mesorhizobium microcysteis]
MVEKRYEWADGAKLEEHSRRKHKILREYVFDYLTVRCRLPQQERFRLAIVDGFAGGGRYQCGSPGSPLIFIEELKRAVEAVNTQRAVQGLGAVEVECLLVFNDANRVAIELLKTHVAPMQAESSQTCPKLHLRVEYLNEFFEVAYHDIKRLLEQGRYRSVIFNLDQCGHSHVERNTILDIMHSYPAAEVFYTFVISSLLAFLQKDQPDRLRAQLDHVGLTTIDVQALDSLMSQKDWLGTAEKIVFDAFRLCAPYVSPFSINNPEGWRYWLIHFANAYRARQVYNNILHDNASLQAHFGRSGLNMLSYDPTHDEGMLYLFDISGRASAKNQLLGDIPRLITESGNAMPVMDFYESIYNITPAHADDVHAAIIENPDLEVITPAGGERRKANTIGVDDVIKIKKQISFFPMFLNAGMKGGAKK